MFTASASRRSRTPKHDITEGQFDRLTEIASRLAIILIGAFAGVVALQAAHAILAPIFLAIVIGLVFGPVADWLEARGIAPALSAGVVVLALILIIAGSVALFAVPLSEWVGKAPAIWAKIQSQLVNWREPLAALGSIQDQIKTALGAGGAVEVTVTDSSQVIDLALIAPAILGDILIFLVSLYFYLATRDNIRISVLSLCVTRRMRWRTAHVFRDVEGKVSRFLLSVTFLNLCVGVAVTAVGFALGLPSPLLWGALAAVLNYIPYVGQGAMIIVLLSVGFASQPDLPHVLAPVGCYMLINLIEGQLVFPQFVGRTMTLNPFLIFLSIIFWIWAWGPFGSLMAVPSLLIMQSVVSNVLPSREIKPSRPVRKTARMTKRDLVLANAAKAIKEQAQEVARAEAAEKEAAALGKTPEKVIEDPIAPRPRKRRRAAVKAIGEAPAT